MMHGVLAGLEAAAGASGSVPASLIQNGVMVRFCGRCNCRRPVTVRALQWRDVGPAAHWPPVVKILLKECEVLVQGGEATHDEASVDIFCRICELRKRCTSLPLMMMLLASARHGV